MPAFDAAELSHYGAQKSNDQFHQEDMGHAWEEGFCRRLDQLLKYKLFDAERLLWLILYSAATRSAIYSSDDLYTFYTNLLSDRKFLSAVDGRTFFEIESHITDGSYNLREGSYCARFERYSLDINTCLLIYIFHENREGLEVAKKETVFTGMRNYFIGNTLENDNFRNFSDLCEVAPSLTSSYVCPSLSHTLQNIRLKKLTSFPMDRVSFLNRYRTPTKVNFAETPELVTTETASRLVAGAARLTSREKANLKNKLGMILRRDTKQRSSVIQKLTAFVDTQVNTIPPCIELALRWLVEKLDKSIVPQTAAGYLNEVFEPLLRAFGDEDIYELEADDIKERLDQVFNYHQSGSDKDVRLRSHVSYIYAFGVREYDIACSDDIQQLIDADAKAGFVRTSILDHRYYTSVLCALDDYPADVFERNQLKLITIFGFRCGLRIGEILKLRFGDIDVEGGWVGHTRANKFGRNKTRYSLRKFLPQTMLSNEEFKLFKDYYRSYKTDNNRLNDLLFGQAGFDAKISTNFIANSIGSVIKQVTRNVDAVFYTLRHSFATAIAATAEGVTCEAKALTGFDDKKLLSLRRLFVPGADTRRDMYRLISSAMGHASAHQTILSYIHCADDLIYAQLNPAAYRLKTTQDLLKKQFNMRPGRLKERPQKRVIMGLVERYSELYQNIVRAETHSNKQTPNFDFQAELPYPVIENAWQAISKGRSVAEVAEDYGFNLEWLHASSDRVFQLSSQRTSRGKYKYHDQSFDEYGALSHYAALHKPKTPAALALSYALCCKLRSDFLSGRQQEVLDWCEIVLTGFTYSHTLLQIKSPTDFQKLTTLVEGLLPNDFWSGNIEITFCSDSVDDIERAERCETAWWNSIRKFVYVRTPVLKAIKRKPVHPEGILTLGVSHAPYDSDHPNSRKFGVRALVYAAMISQCILGALVDTQKTSYMAKPK